MKTDAASARSVERASSGRLGPPKVPASADPLRLAIIIGSTRSGRFGPTVARWFARQARQHDGVRVDVIDLAEARLPARLTDYGEEIPPEVVAETPRLEAADAFVVVTPEYNHSFPACYHNQMQEMMRSTFSPFQFIIALLLLSSIGIPHSLIAQEVVDDRAPDEEAIRTVVAQYADTWNAHDMQRWGTLFTDDVDYVDRGGGWWRSSEENVEAHRGIHERLAQRNHEMDFELTVADIAWLHPSLALVHATAQWPSFYATRGTDDRVWGVMTMVMVGDERGWRIRALQVTQGPCLDQ